MGLKFCASLPVVLCALGMILSQAVHCGLMMFRSSSSVQKQPGQLSIRLTELGAQLTDACAF